MFDDPASREQPPGPGDVSPAPDAPSPAPAAADDARAPGTQPEPAPQAPPATAEAAYERDVDVPAALELAYSAADLGLSPQAYDRAIPYERVLADRRRQASGLRMRRVGRELVETLILAVLIFLAVRAVVQNFRVEGSSMYPSLESNELLLVNKAIYYRVDTHRIHTFLPFIPDSNGEKRHLFRAPRRGDVIVFRFPLDPSRDFIKRVIGVPGDTVEVRDGRVFINGNPLKEDYIYQTPDYSYGPKTVPEGQYFVLGDNRRNSYDSHAWQSNCSQQQTCDFVPEENIIGQAWLRYWPFPVGFVNNKVLKPLAP
ncbi:MAG TPA: signal peptidase I [Dehalococcoidia bacterium]|jgi:signal peptidase I|nr:signal peptidase I [Dehalococcoidia bacterium]